MFEVCHDCGGDIETVLFMTGFENKGDIVDKR